MRVTKEVALRNREAILETATRLFKTRGIDNVSVADLMKDAGFTHGGFYNHFASKADLSIAVIEHAFGKSLSELRESGETLAPFLERLGFYLSPEHRDHPTGGCPTGSLPIDVGRQSADAQIAYADGLEQYIDLISRIYSARAPDKRGAAIATLSTLVGAIILSRAVRDGKPELSDEILSTVNRDVISAGASKDR